MKKISIKHSLLLLPLLLILLGIWFMAELDFKHPPGQKIAVNKNTTLEKDRLNEPPQEETTSKPAVVSRPLRQQSPANPKQNLIAIYRVDTPEKVAALTFDISWGTRIPGPVLDILKQHGVKSTFFLSGPWAKKYPDLARRLVNEGHEIASHGNRHIDLDKEARNTVMQEIMAAHNDLKQVTGHSPTLIRTPNGAYNDMVLQVARDLNYRVIQWSVDSLDWKKPGQEAIIQRVLNNIHPGAIILMHASDTCTQTPSALPRVISGLQERGYRLVTVSELLQMGPAVNTKY
ncbi:MAG: polysaccharide deacetylase family sporulation protein PdaB [Bacillota bacterium]|uniref:polysaccharide deacetylase family sporulation protein PdaB n=1 Tax=Desulfurispora thermophila TaxID=265470 RepID=UPI00036B778E|nr:polysaccharide deacetylase family sporulation protein PdaB [Desulfurispora thermophila]